MARIASGQMGMTLSICESFDTPSLIDDRCNSLNCGVDGSCCAPPQPPPQHGDIHPSIGYGVSRLDRHVPKRSPPLSNLVVCPGNRNPHNCCCPRGARARAGSVRESVPRDLKVRPIHHHLADRVRAHIFLCLLAYYVEWHLREAWRELMFADTDQLAKAKRDPVTPAKRSKAALAKVGSKLLDDGTPAHSFCTLLAELGTIVRNTCRTPSAGPDAPTFNVLTTPNPKRARVLALVQTIHV